MSILDFERSLTSRSFFGVEKLRRRVGEVTLEWTEFMNQPATSLRSHCLSPARARVAIDAPLTPVSYARMFPELPSFEADEQFLHALGRAGGLCDCGDIEDTPDSLGDTAAGWPIFGQFVAHNITADRSVLQSHTNTAGLHNARSPQLNLESLYGDGPTGHPFLYQRDDSAKFLLGLDGTDVQRNGEGIAVIGDPRNDSHMLISQLHLAMLKAHNAFVDEARRTGIANDRVFDEAAKQLRWHYQWLILNEFLPTLIGRTLADLVLRVGPQWFRPGHSGFIPLEFADAALSLRPLSDPPPLPIELTDRSRSTFSGSSGIPRRTTRARDRLVTVLRRARCATGAAVQENGWETGARTHSVAGSRHR